MVKCLKQKYVYRVYENCLTLSFMKYHIARTTIFPISNSITIIAYWNKKKMLSSTIYTEPAGNASYSQETISSTLSRLYYLCNSCLETPITNPNSNQQLSWILPITYFQNQLALRKMTQINVPFLIKLSFANKWLDGINLSNDLHRQSLKYKIPLYDIRLFL